MIILNHLRPVILEFLITPDALGLIKFQITRESRIVIKPRK